MTTTLKKAARSTKMTVSQMREVANQKGIKVPSKVTKAALEDLLKGIKVKEKKAEKDIPVSLFPGEY